MVTPKSFIQRAFAEEIASLEAEVGRVIAMKITPATSRTDLILRLDSVKVKAAILCNSAPDFGRRRNW